MMLSCAKALSLRRCILPLPILTIKRSSYWLNFFTPVPSTAVLIDRQKLNIDTISKETILSLESSKSIDINRLSKVQSTSYNTLQEKGKLSKEDADSFMKKLQTKGEEQEQKAKEKMKEALKEVIDEMGLATKADIEALKKAKEK